MDAEQHMSAQKAVTAKPLCEWCEVAHDGEAPVYQQRTGPAAWFAMHLLDDRCMGERWLPRPLVQLVAAYLEWDGAFKLEHDAKDNKDHLHVVAPLIELTPEHLTHLVRHHNKSATQAVQQMFFPCPYAPIDGRNFGMMSRVIHNARQQSKKSAAEMRAALWSMPLLVPDDLRTAILLALMTSRENTVSLPVADPVAEHAH
jgi:hypothetical protein